MHKIKLIKYHGQRGCNHCYDDNPIYQGITDWEEVDEQTYQQLYQAIQYNKENLFLVRQMPDQAKLIKTTIDNYLTEQKQKEDKRKADEAKYLADKKAKKEKRDLAKLEKLKKQYEANI